MTDPQFTKATGFSEQNKLRLAYFVSHPIQYQAPLLRRIAEEQDIDLKVFFSSDISVKGYFDRQFGVHVTWDTPLLEGYNYEFLPVLRNGKNLGFATPLNYGIKRRIREQKIDAVWVHGYSTLTNLQAIWAASSLRIPVLVRTDSTLFNLRRSGLKLALKKLFFDTLKPKISGVLSAGHANTAYYRHYFGEQFPIFPCNYAVDNRFFQNGCEAASKSREEFRSSLGLDAGRPVILSVSKLGPDKRCVDLLEAYLQVSKSGGTRHAPYLLFVGDGEERSALENRAREAKPGDVHFLGFRNQSELPRFYDLCDVFAMPAIYEAWGLTVNEVMNAGRAVIVSDQVGCQRDLVRPGVNGYVVAARDVNGLAECLRAVLADEQTCREMGKQSLRIIQEYSFDQNVSGLRQALQALVPGF